MNIHDVLTIAEAAEVFGLNTSTLIKACKGQKGYPPIFHEGEYRQSGKTWLITRDAMERVYHDRLTNEGAKKTRRKRKE